MQKTVQKAFNSIFILLLFCTWQVCGWFLAYRSSAGSGTNFYSEWNSVGSVNDQDESLKNVNPSVKGHFKSRFVDDWGGVTQPSKVKITFNKNGVEEKFVTFSAGNDKLNWFEKSHIFESSYPSLNATAAAVNLSRDTFGESGVAFAIWNYTTSGCAAELWSAILEVNFTSSSCSSNGWGGSQSGYPQYVYSPKLGAVNNNEFNYADVFAIYLEYNKNCTSPPDIINATRGSYSSLSVGEQVTYNCKTGTLFPNGLGTRNSTCLPDATWSLPTTQKCQVHCTPLSVDNANSSTLASSVPQDTQVTYTCNPGYRFSDNSSSKTTTCLSTGSWTDNLPSCKEIECPILPTYVGTTYNTKLTSYKTTVTLSCDKGYQFHDSTLQRTTWCGETGDWVYKINGCQDVTCPSAPAVKNCDRTSSNNTYGTVITYTCQEGKRMLDGSPSKTIKCTATGKWSDVVTDCEDNRCIPLIYVANSKPSKTDARFGDIVTVTCKTGYFFQGDVPKRTTECKNTGRWDPILPMCEPVRCPAVKNYSNTAVNTTENLYATRVEYKCDLGYRFPDNSTVKVPICQVNKTWSIDVKPCSVVHCNPHGDITNATRTGSGTVYDTQIQFKCSEGYRFLDGKYERTIRCTEHATWNETGFDCRTDRCGPIPDVKNAIPSTRNTTWWTIVYYTCMPGYRFPDNSSVKLTMCTVDAVWNTTMANAIPNCEPLPCDLVPQVANSTANNTNNRLFPAVVGYSCQKGHRFQGDALSAHIQCTAISDGVKWAPTLTGCQPVHCPLPPFRVNASSDTNNTVYGTMATYNCLDGYEFDVGGGVNQTIECDEFANWYPNVSDCHPVVCPKVPTWLDMEFNDTEREYGTVISYYCHDEYVFEDIKKDPSKQATASLNRTSVCNAGMWWEPAITECVEGKGIMDDLKGVTYEADGAVSIGTIALALMCTLLTLIVLLDSFKLYTDLKFMAYNLKCFYERIRDKMTKNKKSASKNSLQKLIYDKF